MTATTARLLPFHNLGPLDIPATLEQYETLRLRHVYRPKTVAEHLRVLRRAAKSGADIFGDPPVTIAAALYDHMSPERAAGNVNEAASMIEAFQLWHRVKRNRGEV